MCIYVYTLQIKLITRIEYFVINHIHKMESNVVRLKCVEEKGKLRVKIISQGYHHDANCQFPRDIRQEGNEYIVPASDIKFSEMRCKFFYRVKKGNIQIINQSEITNLKIFKDDDDSSNCCICLTGSPEVIFYPCGHYYCCQTCGNSVGNCPICRALITQRVTKEQLTGEP